MLHSTFIDNTITVREVSALQSEHSAFSSVV